MQFELIRLELEKFRCLDSFVLEPDKIVITGRNGSGKTSVLLALYDALYGLQPANCQDGSKETYLHMKCVINGMEHDIERAPGRAKCKLDTGETIEGVREVNAHIVSRLPKEVISLALNLSNFPELSSTEKKAILDLIMKSHEADKYVVCAKQLKEEVRLQELEGRKAEILEQITDLENDIAKEKDRLLKEEQNRANERQRVLSIIEDKVKELEAKKEELSQIESELVKLDVSSIEEKIRLIDTTSLEHQLQVLISQLNELTELQPLKEEIVLEQVKSEQMQLLSEISKLQLEQQNIQKQAELIKQNYSSEIKRIQENATLQLLQKQKQDLLDKLSQLDHTCPLCGNVSESKIEVSINACPVCNSAIEDRRSELNRQLQELEQHIRTTEEVVQRELAEFEATFKQQIDELRQQWKAYNDQIKALQAQVEQKRQYIEQLQEEIAKKKAEQQATIEAKKVKLEEEIQRIRNEISEKEQIKQNLRNQIAQIQQTKNELENKRRLLSSQIQSLEDEINQLKVRSQELAKPVDTDILHRLEASLHQAKQKLTQLDKDIDNAKDQIQVYDFWIKAFRKDLKTLMLSRLLPALNNKLIELGTQFNIVPHIEIHNNEFHVFGNDRPYKLLSTGEKRIASFLTNLVICQYFDSNIYGYDETFDGLDDSNIQRVAAILSKMDKNLIVVTHNKFAASLLEGFNQLEFGVSTNESDLDSFA